MIATLILLLLLILGTPESGWLSFNRLVNYICRIGEYRWLSRTTSIFSSSVVHSPVSYFNYIINYLLYIVLTFMCVVLFYSLGTFGEKYDTQRLTTILLFYVKIFLWYLAFDVGFSLISPKRTWILHFQTACNCIIKCKVKIQNDSQQFVSDTVG